jgi:hypothetical protein
MNKELFPNLDKDIDSLEQIRDQIRSDSQSIKTREDIEKIKQLQIKAREKMMEMKLYESRFEMIQLVEEARERDLETQKQIGFLETLSTGREGIIDVFGEEHPFPTTEEILERLENKKEIIELKLKQYHRPKLLIVPFGKSIVSEEGVCFASALEQTLIKYKDTLHNEDGSWPFQDDTDQLKTDTSGNLFANDDRPVWIWDQYKNAEESGDLVYDAQELTENHQGKTKKQKIDEIGGYSIILIDDIVDLPQTGQDKEGRKTPDAGKTPQEYLQMLTDPNNPECKQYQGERGHYIEETIYQYISNLIQQKGLVTDNFYQERKQKGKATYSIGNYFKSSRGVPYSYWGSDLRRVNLLRDVRGDRNSNFSARLGVGV